MSSRPRRRRPTPKRGLTSPTCTTRLTTSSIRRGTAAAIEVALMRALRVSLAIAALAAMTAPGSPLSAQGSGASVADTSPFRPLDLPTPNQYRTGSGRPGPLYWQQRADYRIKATLDPQANELRGSETIHYVNHSPDALPYLWMFVEQNLCEPTSITNVLNQ